MEKHTSDAAAQAAAPTPQSGERTFFGHPWGLANLFGVEMWERFSFYGMQALVLLYMYYATTDGGLGLDRADATSIVGAYGGLVYMACLLASLVADRVLGAERTLFYSASMVMLGHIALAFIPAITGLAIGLVLIAIGSGGVKTTAQVVLGAMYSRDDPRRDGGFSIFYMGVNIGALVGPLLTTALWGWQGFHWGFGIAAIGMALGLIQYSLMRKTTIKDAGHEVPNPASFKQLLMGVLAVAAIIVVMVVALATGAIQVDWLSNIVTAVALLAAVYLWVQMYTSKLVTREEKNRLLGFIPMFISGVLFFGIFQQQFTVMTIYSDVRLDRHVFGWEIPPSLVQSINPIFIVIFSAVFATMWTKLGDRQWSTPVKFGAANIVIGISLFFFLPFSGAEANSTPMYVIIFILFLFTMAELLLSPVGNSLATKVAPEAFPSRMMAVWMMAVAMGTSLAGSLASFYNPDDAGAENTFFISLGVVSIVLGGILLVLSRWVVKKFSSFR
ncbi:peptide MFS transporter [Corynebacterium kefirresidentii]|uniref:Peptide MFS transporter n=1 Tax=Corynebacterium kefirresidentii TaxID=1979527 RepID=A0ABT8Q514_9CORY|nr:MULTISPECIES: peptide MFS transporter [Corynebacterium]MCG7449677.1 peptide MFS transporter [Corynebacterium kefirresidentii]MCG7451889.1 peptide MFS transporter [Corynebacterium kefirresidentii]MDK8837430.1 peptide MFS transporter [Corynebacterium kefirresidentii]MDN8619541.1 peptide MFS transporter [Corynebacterium kefirresidentii]MDN8641915.1 peptide MFS transporter [Corynebacterium kefirresidentii]